MEQITATCMPRPSNLPIHFPVRRACSHHKTYIWSQCAALSIYMRKSHGVAGMPTGGKCPMHHTHVRCSIVVSISACHAEDPGSIPGGGVFIAKGISPPLCVICVCKCHAPVSHTPGLAKIVLETLSFEGLWSGA